MSKRTPQLPEMPSPPPQSEKFLAMLLWAQKGDCQCLCCQYFKDFGQEMMDKHVKK